MPTNKANKVKFGLKNVHYAPLTVGEDGSATYSTPVRVPGAVNLSMDAQGDTSTFYADDMAYYVSAANDGYSGDLEVAVIPDSFRKDILQETEDETNKVLVENVSAEPKPFALLFEFSGDQKAVRHVLYNCAATRPGVTGSTTNNTKEPSTETMTLTASPLSNGNIKDKTTPDTPDAKYNNWYQSVWQPLEKLTVTSAAGQTAGKTALTVSPEKAEGNSYKVKTGSNITLPSFGEVCGSDYTDWDGSEEVEAVTGQKILVVEVTADNKAKAGGIADVTAKDT